MLKVLLLSDFTSAYSRLLLKGFLRYSMEVGNWRFYRIPLSREDFNDEKAIETVIDIAQRWGADAIMGQLSEVNTERLRSIGIPVILKTTPIVWTAYPILPVITTAPAKWPLTTSYGKVTLILLSTAPVIQSGHANVKRVSVPASPK